MQLSAVAKSTKSKKRSFKWKYRVSKSFMSSWYSPPHNLIHLIKMEFIICSSLMECLEIGRKKTHRVCGYLDIPIPHIWLNICGYFQSKFTMRIGKIYAHIQLIFEYDIRIGKICAHCTYLVYSNIYAYPNESALTKTEWTTLFFTHHTFIV